MYDISIKHLSKITFTGTCIASNSAISDFHFLLELSRNFYFSWSRWKQQQLRQKLAGTQTTFPFPAKPKTRRPDIDPSRKVLERERAHVRKS